MAQNVPYRGIKKSELKKLMKQSTSVTSFAGQEYEAMHGSIIKEIQTQKDRNARVAQKSQHMMINSGIEEPYRLQPEIQFFINGLHDIVKEDQFDNLCELAISNITIETQPEPKAEKILVRGEKARSKKLYNIRFNIKGMISLLFDWLLLGQIDEASTLQLIVMLIKSVGELYDLCLVEFDSIHALILQEWYRLPKENGGVEENKLIEMILTKYQGQIENLNENSIAHAIDELVKFHCADIDDGILTLTESIVIE